MHAFRCNEIVHKLKPILLQPHRTILTQVINLSKIYKPFYEHPIVNVLTTLKGW